MQDTQHILMDVVQAYFGEHPPGIEMDTPDDDCPETLP